jgi:hypothetical protein
MLTAKKPERMRKTPPCTAKEVERTTRVEKILPDEKNLALVFCVKWHNQTRGADGICCTPESVRGTTAGIRSLVAERDMLRKLVKEVVEDDPQDAVPPGWRRLEDGEIRGEGDKYLKGSGFWGWCEISQGRKQGSAHAKEVCIRKHLPTTQPE